MTLTPTRPASPTPAPASGPIIDLRGAEAAAVPARVVSSAPSRSAVSIMTGLDLARLYVAPAVWGWLRETCALSRRRMAALISIGVLEAVVLVYMAGLSGWFSPPPSPPARYLATTFHAPATGLVTARGPAPTVPAVVTGVPTQAPGAVIVLPAAFAGMTIEPPPGVTVVIATS